MNIMSDYNKIFKMPKTGGITGRTSSITSAFVTAIIPTVPPSEQEIQKSLEILNLSADDLRCAYCGDKATEWDHLRPIVSKKMPTGYLSDIYNLVPACGKCNQSKGNKNWKEWIVSSAKLSPKSRGTTDINNKIKMLDKYEKWKEVKSVNYGEMVGEELWKKHWENCRRLHDDMIEAQKHAKKLRDVIAKILAKS